MSASAPTPAPAAAAPAAAPVPQPAAAAVPAPAPTPAKPSAEDVLRQFDVDFDAMVAKTKAEIAEEPSAPKAAQPPQKAEPEAKPEAKPEAEAKEPEGAEEEPQEAAQPDGEWEEGIVPPSPEDALPETERAALKAIKDPKIRRAFARAHYLVKGYEKAGMRLSEIPKYLAVAPNPEVLEERVERAGQLDSFVEEFSSGNEESIYRVAEVLRQTSPDGWTRLVDAVIDNIHVVRPEKIRPLGDKIMGAVVRSMRAKAEKDGDLVLADHADGLEEYLGLKAKAQQGRSGRDETRVDPELRRRLEEADEIRARERQREAEMFAERYKVFNEAVVHDATTEGVGFIKGWIDDHCGAYSNDAKAELFDRMANEVLGQMQSNAHVTNTLRRLMDDGPGDEAHRRRCAEYLVKTSRSLFVTVAPSVLSRFQKVFGETSARRAEKVARAKTSRDVGSAGAVAPVGDRKLVGKGKHVDDVLKEFDALEAGGSR